MFALLQKMRSRRARRRVQSVANNSPCEVLEDKTLLVGNVFATMNAAGDLTLRGDGQANQVTVTSIANGVQVLGTGGTRINGLPVPTLFPGASITDINARLRGGNDSLTIRADVGGDVDARMGGGSDIVTILDTSVGGDTDINVGAAFPGLPEVVTINATTIDGEMNLRGGGGQQRFIITTSTVIGPSSVRMGGGRDFLNTSATNFVSGLQADGGGGAFDTFINIGASATHRRFELFT